MAGGALKAQRMAMQTLTLELLFKKTPHEF
jgi:hypothetical protein